MKYKMSSFEKKDLDVLRKLDNIYKIQDFVDNLKYEYGERISPLEVIRTGKGDCLEAALFACMAFKFHNKEAFLIDLRAERDEDHILCVAKTGNKYGSVAQSKFLGLRGRVPVYSSVRELVMRYFENYFNFYGELTLREYSVPFDPDKKYSDWRINSETMSQIEQDVDSIKHFKISIKEKLPRVSKEKFWREILIQPKHMKVGKAYKK